MTSAPANTCVYARGKGIVVNEPSIVAINKVNGRIEAVGREAKEMLGRTPGNIIAIKPMKDGVIADFECHGEDADLLHQESPQPHGVGAAADRHRRAVRDLPGGKARGQGQRLPGESERGAPRRGGDGRGDRLRHADHRAVGEHDRRDIGGGTTDIAVISLAGIVYSKAVRVAGNEMDEAIIQYVKKTYNLLIGERTAEQIKMQIGSAYQLDARITFEIKGRQSH